MTPYLPAHTMHAPGPGAFLTLKASKPLKIGNGKGIPQEVLLQ